MGYTNANSLRCLDLLKELIPNGNNLSFPCNRLLFELQLPNKEIINVFHPELRVILDKSPGQQVFSNVGCLSLEEELVPNINYVTFLRNGFLLEFQPLHQVSINML